MPTKNSGFTLIEIMLVLVLLSLSAVAVIMNLPESTQDTAKQQAQRFYYRLQLLNEDAILNGKDLGIRIEERKGTYIYMTLEEDGWVPFENRVYTETQLEDGLTLEFNLGSDIWSKNESFFKQESLFEEMFEEQEKKVSPPQLFVLSSGEVTPFRLTIYAENRRQNGWSVEAKESGVIELQQMQQNSNEANF